MLLTIVILSGLLWILSYVGIIYRGFKDKSYGMPLIPLALNFMWELTFSLIYPPYGTAIEVFIILILHLLWLLLDLTILITFLLYGYSSYKKYYQISKNTFYFIVFSCFLLSFLIIVTAAPFFRNLYPYFHGNMFESAKFIALVMNTIISISFISMFLSRRSNDGQSFTIAWSKWLGTFGFNSLSISFGINLVSVLCVIIFILDVLYTLLIYRQLKEKGINPWLRL